MDRRRFLGMSAWVGGAALLGLVPGSQALPAPVVMAGGRLRGVRYLAYLGKHLGSWCYPDPDDLRRMNLILVRDAGESCRKRYLGYDFPTLRMDPPGVGRWFRAESLGVGEVVRSGGSGGVTDDREWYRVTLSVQGYYHSDPPRFHPLEEMERARMLHDFPLRLDPTEPYRYWRGEAP